METDKAGKDLIKQWEGVRYSAYLDSVGIPTIGVGHIKGVKMGDKATPEQVERWLVEDLREAEGGVNQAVTVPLNQNMFDALVSLTFNIGVGAFNSSTLLKKLNTGLYKEASEQFLVWNKVTRNGVKEEERGLTNRRRAEQALFLKPYG